MSLSFEIETPTRIEKLVINSPVAFIELDRFNNDTGIRILLDSLLNRITFDGRGGNEVLDKRKLTVPVISKELRDKGIINLTLSSDFKKRLLKCTGGIDFQIDENKNFDWLSGNLEATLWFLGNKNFDNFSKWIVDYANDKFGDIDSLTPTFTALRESNIFPNLTCPENHRRERVSTTGWELKKETVVYVIRPPRSTKVPDPYDNEEVLESLERIIEEIYGLKMISFQCNTETMSREIIVFTRGSEKWGSQSTLFNQEITKMLNILPKFLYTIINGGIYCGIQRCIKEWREIFLTPGYYRAILNEISRLIEKSGIYYPRAFFILEDGIDDDIFNEYSNLIERIEDGKGYYSSKQSNWVRKPTINNP